MVSSQRAPKNSCVGHGCNGRGIDHDMIVFSLEPFQQIGKRLTIEDL